MLTRDRGLRRDRRAQPADDAAARRHQRTRGARAGRRTRSPLAARRCSARSPPACSKTSGAASRRPVPRRCARTSPTSTPSETYDRVYEIYRRPVRTASGRSAGAAAARAQTDPHRRERRVSRLPSIGLLGIMQELYDDMLPGITERQGAVRLARSPSGWPASPMSVHASGAQPRGRRVDRLASWSVADVDGIAIVMLTYGPAMRTVRALMRCAGAADAGQHPARALDHRRLGHGRPDLQPGHPRRPGPGQRAGPRPACRSRSSPETGGRTSSRARSSDWARAAQAVTSLRRTRIALLGYPMNGMGDILYDPPSLMRRLGPMIVSEDLGALVAQIAAVSDADVDAVIARTRSAFEVASDLPRERHAYAARFEVAIRGDARGAAATPASRSTSTRSAATAASSSCRCWRHRT